MNEDEQLHVKCACGFTLRINLFDLYEIESGTWGTISCPNCSIRMNDKIKKATKQYDEDKKKKSKDP